MCPACIYQSRAAAVTLCPEWCAVATKYIYTIAALLAVQHIQPLHKSSSSSSQQCFVYILHGTLLIKKRQMQDLYRFENLYFPAFERGRSVGRSTFNTARRLKTKKVICCLYIFFPNVGQIVFGYFQLHRSVCVAGAVCGGVLRKCPPMRKG